MGWCGGEDSLKAIIYAGGMGTRLGELTKNTPKPLIQIGKKSVLEHIVDRLYQHGITQIIVKVHYLPGQIMEKLGDRVLYYYEPALFDWKDSLTRLEKWVGGEEFLCLNGDTISDVDFSEMIQQHKDDAITILLDDYRACGVWIYPKNYFAKKDFPLVPYRPKDLHWFDIGVPLRLEAAKKHFEEGEVII